MRTTTLPRSAHPLHPARTRTVRGVLAAAGIALGLTLTACSSSSTTPAASAPSATATTGAAQPGVVFNPADVTFLQQMYPHHAQAVEMAKLVDGRTTTPAVVALAGMIQGEQSPEMTTMTTLLTSFGQPTPSTSTDMSGMSGMGSSSTQGMPGMMSATDMSTLGGLSGTAFDQKWLTMMTAHHQGAITMATTELSDGTNPDAQKLATGIISAQKAEIATMASLIH